MKEKIRLRVNKGRPGRPYQRIATGLRAWLILWLLGI